MFKKKDFVNRRKRHRYPIAVKFLSLTTLFLAMTLASMVGLATYYYKSDNETRIEENTHKISEIIALKVKTDFTSIVEKSNLMAATLLGESGTEAQTALFAELFFAKDRDLIFVGIANKSESGSIEVINSIANEKFLADNGLAGVSFRDLINSEKKYFSKSFNTETEVHNSSPFFKIPVVGISLPYTYTPDGSAASVLVIYVSMERFLDAVRSPGIIKSYIVNGEGDVIAHYDSSLVIAKANFMSNPIVKMMFKSPIDNGYNKYLDDKREYYLGSFKKGIFSDIGVISTVREDTALKSVYMLRKRNFLIAIIVFSIAILLAYYFSEMLTNPIKKLVGATHQIREGNYEVAIDWTTNDEIGDLSQSFSRMAKGLAEREKIKDAFGKFVNKEIAERVLRDEIKLGGERKYAAIFFSDIRSFTAISETLEPEEVVEFLNEYMSLMVKCVNETHGVVDKFIGDAIMAQWGTVVSYGNDTENAVNASLMMRKVLAEFNKGRGTPKKPLIKIGCGINSGPVLAGQIGSSDRMEYTVIGDTVNLASRIESLNKPFGTDILISADAYKAVEGIFNVEKMQKIKVKGKTEPQQIYAVLGRKDDPESFKSIEEMRAFLGIDSAALKPANVDEEEKKYEILE